METSHQIIRDLLDAQPRTRGELSSWKRKAAQDYSMPLISNALLLEYIRREKTSSLDFQFPISNFQNLERLLRVRDVRTLSGVAIITVLVKPYACPGQCVYCPTEVRMPKSYIETEPAAQRALRLNFDPYEQMIRRLDVLERNGHPTDKIELIVKGGTWSAYPKAYQRWFLKECYRATNEFNVQDPPHTKYQIPDTRYAEVQHLNQGDRTFVENFNKRGAWASGEASETEILTEEERNESAEHRIIGLTLETRPDWITPEEVRQLRVLGCTRIELGAQAIDDDILTRIKRGHDVASIARAMALLRAAGFKVDVHMMPQLPGTTPQNDIAMFTLLFSDERFRPDMIKIYPCVVTPSAELYRWWKNGEYTPYSDRELIETLMTIKSQIIPRYCRISRLIRDIPAQHIAAGNIVTNLRETIQKTMKGRGLKCRCLRCREVGHQENTTYKTQHAKLYVEEYGASGGTEYFLSMESEDRNVVYGFCRLRIPNNTLPPDNTLFELLPEIRNCAFIRELHVYGQLVPIHDEQEGAAQHTGLGRQLMEHAEQIARSQGIARLAVIAGVGVREYYRKLGYATSGTYMIKSLSL